jgi:4'-phosphopantetheinyl transferase EntD
MIELDTSHVALATLRDLLPEATVAGGSFSSLLPPPRMLSSDDRRTEYERVRELAIETCLARAASDAGLSGITIRRGDDGARQWPRGFVGSLSDKGTVVATALAPISILRALGIDLELIDDSASPLDAALIGADSPRGFAPAVQTLLTFSAKEAVFKAQFPLTGAKLQYLDIELDWSGQSSPHLEAIARSPRFPEPLIVRSATSRRWIVAIAASMSSLA